MEKTQKEKIDGEPITELTNVHYAQYYLSKHIIELDESPDNELLILAMECLFAEIVKFSKYSKDEIL